MSNDNDLLNQTRLRLAQAKEAYKIALAEAEMLEIEVMESRQAAELAAAKASKLSRVLEILDSDYVPEPIPVSTARFAPSAPAPAQQAAPAPEGVSVAEAVAAAKAAGDPLANRTIDGGGREDSDAPPPSNRPQGPACPGCGTPGSMVQAQIMVGDRGPFPAVVCSHCGHQKAMI